jgi:hydrogenase nickel incorporation protein HypA/HybF
MHELSIVQALVKVAEEEMRAAGASRVLALELTLGALSGVVEHYLRAAFPIAVRGTLLEAAELRIVLVQGRGYCPACERDFPLSELLDPCPDCGGYASEIREGQQLILTSLEVE